MKTASDFAIVEPLAILRGKRILVTGAASGVGLGAAAFFERAGAGIVVTDRDDDLLATAWSGLTRGGALKLDATDERQCVEVVAAAIETLGGLDRVFNNAGINALAPTCIGTPMVERLEAEGRADVARLERRTPMGRIGEVGAIAAAAAFLRSGMSPYTTGVVMPVDRGWLAYSGLGAVETA